MARGGRRTNSRAEVRPTLVPAAAEPGPEPELVSSCSVSALSESSPQPGPSPGRVPGHREWRDQSSGVTPLSLRARQCLGHSSYLHGDAATQAQPGRGGAVSDLARPGLWSPPGERGRAQITGHGGGALCPEPQS